MKRLLAITLCALIAACAEENKTINNPVSQIVYPELTGTCAVYTNIVKRWRNADNTIRWTFYSDCTGKLETNDGPHLTFEYRTNIVNKSSAYPTMDDYLQFKVTSSTDTNTYPIGYYEALHFWYIKEINQIIMQQQNTAFAFSYIQF